MQKAAANGSKRGAAKATGKRTPRGAVSAGIYTAVEKLVGDSKMSRLAAFRQLAKTSGRNVGAISAGYYYAAKKRGAKRRRPGKSSAGGRRGPWHPRAQSLLAALEKLVGTQAAQLETLRRDNERFAALRALIARR
jgi:hypothetical protein